MSAESEEPKFLLPKFNLKELPVDIEYDRLFKEYKKCSQYCDNFASLSLSPEERAVFRLYFIALGGIKLSNNQQEFVRNQMSNPAFSLFNLNEIVKGLNSVEHWLFTRLRDRMEIVAQNSERYLNLPENENWLRQAADKISTVYFNSLKEDEKSRTTKLKYAVGTIRRPN